MAEVRHKGDNSPMIVAKGNAGPDGRTRAHVSTGTAAGAAAVPIEPSLITRIGRGVRYLLSGQADVFMGPGQPLAPVAQDAAGRTFDYPTMVNTNITPRSYEAISFPTLRSLADGYDLVRLAIETRKDQLAKMPWHIARKDGNELDAKGQAIQDFLQMPDRENDFTSWSRLILEDLFVIDAPTVYIHRTRGGGVFSLDVVDGATINRKIDDRGRTPFPPDPAYQQVIKGMPAVDYTRDELIYRPRNQRTNKIYGYSPVEQVILIVNIAMRREVFQLEYFTEGNVPDMLLNAPKEWSPVQIAEFQQLFDEVLAGDTAARRRVRFVPGDTKAQMTRGEPLFDTVTEEWFARVVCYAFSLPANAFTKQVNRATATNAQEVSLEEGLEPLMVWKSALMNRLLIAGWGTTDYVFEYDDAQDIDPEVQSIIDVAYTGGATGTGPKIRSVQEVRDDHGWGPLPAELQQEADALLDAKINPPTPVIAAPGAGAAPQDKEKKPGKAGAKVAEKLQAIEDSIAKITAPQAAPFTVHLPPHQRRGPVRATKTAAGEFLIEELPASTESK